MVTGSRAPASNSAPPPAGGDLLPRARSDAPATAWPCRAYGNRERARALAGRKGDPAASYLHIRDALRSYLLPGY